MNNNRTQAFHVAIIMDGNNRWAQREKLTLLEGHRAGAKNFKHIAENALDLGITDLTCFAFSSENWNRPTDEVEDLMDLLREYMTKEMNAMYERNISLKVIGNLNKLPKDIVEQIQIVTEKTKDCNGLNLNIALSYGAREEIVQASKNIATKVLNGHLSIDDINEDLLRSMLYHPYLNDVDLLIRTSGEQRISNFLLWQIAYAELAFTDTLWPDFTIEELKDIISNYNNRERRFGRRPNNYE